MLELVAFVILSALGGYGIGRTLVSESIFEGIIGWIVDLGYYPQDDETMVDATGAVFYLDVDGMPHVLSKDGYRTDLWRIFALPLGKLSDLLSCETCATTQAALQLFFWGSIIGVLALEVVALAATVGLGYIIISKLS